MRRGTRACAMPLEEAYVAHGLLPTGGRLRRRVHSVEEAMRHASTSRRALMLVGVSLILGCGGASASSPDGGGTPPPPPPPPPPANTVRVTNNTFTPGDLTVPAGTTVTWSWDTCSGGGDPYGGGETCVSHSVAMDDGSFSSSTQSAGSFTHQFATAGTYTYHCAVHGAAMSGKIIVQ